MRLKIDNGEQNVLLPLLAIRPATIHEKKTRANQKSFWLERWRKLTVSVSTPCCLRYLFLLKRKKKSQMEPVFLAEQIQNEKKPSYISGRLSLAMQKVLRMLSNAAG